MTRRPPWLFVLIGVLLVVALFLLRKALLPFFVAMVLAYLLEPLVRRLQRHMHRSWAVTLVLLVALGSFVLVLALVLPWLWEQGERFVNSIPTWRQGVQQKLAPWLTQHPHVQVKVDKAIAAFDPMVLAKGLQVAGSGLLSSFLSAMALLLVPLIQYYLLLEGPRLLAHLDDLVPPRHRARVRAFVRDVHVRLGGYIRGQLAVATVMSLLQGLGFQLLGVPYAWLLGLVAGFANFLPYFPYLAALPSALLLAGLGGASWGRVLGIALLFTGIQKLETLYFTPVWVGRATRLHPLEVMLALLSFGFAFGILGLIFAVPLMIVIKVSAEHFLEEYRTHPWFLGSSASEPS